VTIESAGSFYLTGNLTMAGEGNGITVTVDDVTIDLMGFSLIGDGAALDGDAIGAPPIIADRSNITIRNGIIRGWPDDGIDFNLSADDLRIEDLHILDCGGDGVFVGNSAVVHDVTVENCGESGISTNLNSTLTNCVAYGNGGNGFRTGTSSVVTNCAAYDNGENGFQVDGSVTGCVAAENSLAGISGGAGAVISNCAVENNSVGINIFARGQVVNSRIDTSGATGVDLGDRSSLRDCEVTVTNVVNDIDGVVVADDCLVIGNVIRGHVNGDSIIVSGDRNRIEANMIVNADNGINVEGSNNLVIRNSFSDIDGDEIVVPLNPNTFGPTVTSANIGTSGNPHANYSH
jgi:hypothetical protein